MRVRMIFLVMVLAGCAGGPDHGVTQRDSRRGLATAMVRRLDVAREVAWFKYREGEPVADRRREASLLDAAAAQGRMLGLPERAVRRFFSAQMRASRIYQQTLTSQWRRGGTLPAAPPRDLVYAIRPEIDQLNTRILQAFAAEARIPRDLGLARQIRNEMARLGIPASAARAAVAPLR